MQYSSSRHSTRLFTLGGLLLLGFYLFSNAYYLSVSRDQLLQNHHTLLKSRVHTAISQVNNYHLLAMSGNMSVQAAQAAARKALRGMRFSDSEYFWITDRSGSVIMHPVFSDMIGKPLRSVTAVENQNLAQNVASLVKEKGNGYLRYNWPKPGFRDAVDKLGYVQHFEPWGWVVGTAVYVDDLYRFFWDEVTVIAITSLVMIFVVLLFWFGVQNRLEDDAPLMTRLRQD